MPTRPGPFVLPTPASVHFDVVNYDFVGFVNGGYSDMDAVLAGFDQLLPDLENFALDLSDPIPDINLDDVLAVVGSHANDHAAVDFGQLDTAITAADIALGLAIAATPAQAWMDLPAPYVPSSDGLTLAPATLDPKLYNPGTVTAVGPAPPAPTGGTPSTAPTVHLVNLTNYGNANFSVGDRFQVTVTGPAGAAVVSRGTLNGQSAGEELFGYLDSTGKFTIPGQMDTTVVGAWSQQWYVGGQFVTMLDFLVLPA